MNGATTNSRPFMDYPRVLLGSASPRRAEFLRQAGIEFRIKSADIDEIWPPDLPVDRIAEYLACQKANVLYHLLEEDEVLLTADTTVLLDNQVLNKPQDFEDAVRMLSLLSNRCHRVVSGVCLHDALQKSSVSVETKVHMAPLDIEEIHYYINRCAPYDKAGAYGIQEWIGQTKIHKIEGSYSNVVGLPMAEVYQLLRAHLK